MPNNPNIPLALRPVEFSLDPFERSRANAFNFRRNLAAEEELEGARARAEQLRQAYRQQYGEAPGGLAGPAPGSAPPPGLGAPQTPYGAGEAPFPPLAEQEAAAQQQALYGLGAASPMEYTPRPGATGPMSQTMEYRDRPGGPGPTDPYAQTMEYRDRPGGPGAPGQYAQTMGAGGLGSQSPSQNPFIRKLYTIDPAAGREAEKHAYDSRTLELAQAKERVEYLGRVADGVLSVGTQEAHNVARAQLIQDGMPPSQIPVTYDPQLWTMFSGTARTASERLRAGELDLNRQQFQYKQREASSKVPDYGLGEKLNPIVYGMFGEQIAPGQRPTPAMEQAARARLARDEEAKELFKQGLEAPGKEREAAAKEQEGLGKRENELRDEFIDLTKDFRAMRDGYGRVKASVKDPSPAGDVSMIFGYMKLLDPGSVVMVGEQATVKNARGVPDTIRNLYNRVMSGEELSPKQRADFSARAETLYDQGTKDYQRTKTQYEGLARRYGADPANVTLEFGSTAERGPAPAPATPARPLPTTKEAVRQERDALRRELGGGNP